MANLKRNAGWLAAVLVVSLFAVTVVFAPRSNVEAQAGGWERQLGRQDAQRTPLVSRARVESPSFEFPAAQMPDGRQILGDDLIVEGGQTLEGNWSVYDGDAVVESGGRLAGSLVVYRGDIQIEEGGTVEGDVTASGDIGVAGQVGGSVTSWSGDVDLSSAASVEGDVNALSGDIEQEDGAFVGGSVVEGPALRLPRAPGRGMPGLVGPIEPLFGGIDHQVGFGEWLVRSVLRMIAAALLTALVVLLVGVFAYTRPETVDKLRRTMSDNLALSFVVGLLANLTLLFLGGLLAVTICLLPVALVPILALLGINLMGWSAVSQVTGERIATFSKQPVHSAVAVVVGAIVLTGVVAFLWALGGCFRFIGFITFLAIASFGAGAVIVPWLNRRRDDGGTTGGSNGGRMPSDGPSGGPAPARTSGVAGQETQPGAGATPGVEAGIDTDVAAPVDYVTAQDVIATEEASAEGAVPVVRDTPAVQEVQQPPEKSTETPDLDVAAPVDYLTAEEVIAAQTAAPAKPAPEDNFTQIKGIGPVTDSRLKAAGIRTFGQLAATPPERIAEIIGWPLERVIRNDLPGQASHFAASRAAPN
jgi:predicted flap endonuclease-1-like 5' DNA nuclease/cytoskeletal protein CcmA (bactofilin family)